ncbi:MAG: glutamate-1-semialdehyde 2,1-aminomutase, partial [bacterium]
MFPQFTQNQKDLKPGRYDKSNKLFIRAQTLIPGGVNSPVRAFKGVGGTPVFVAGAFDAVIQDMDENQYVDYVLSWGPMILGHGNKHVIKAITDTAMLGTSFGAPTDKETYIADIIQSRHDHVDMVRLVNSGTEATMSAIRLARGYTGKDRILKCEGCYHGHADSLLVDAGSGLATQGVASSAGVPQAVADLTTVIPFNDIDAVKTAFEKYDDLACFILEPIAGNMGCIPPKEGYLQAVRKLCDTHSVLLILDEV